MNITELLQKYQFQTKHQLGQNFLNDQKYLDLIASSTDISNQNILEVGPGLGVLTHLLCEKAHKVIAVELDETAIKVLQETCKFPNLEIINQDILKFQIPENFKEYKVIANIPYYITSPIINKFILENFRNNQELPKELILLTQKEVADKICHPHKNSVLSLNVKLFAQAEIISYVPANAFIPAPKVDSAIIKITPHSHNLVSLEDLDLVLQIISASFFQKRKKLVNSISKSLQSVPGKKPLTKITTTEIKEILNELNISTDIRAEDLEVINWLEISRNIKKRLIKE